MEIIIVTAFTEDMSQDFQLFYKSLRSKYDIPLVVYDIDDKLDCACDCIKIKHPKEHEFKSHEYVGHRWMQWYKPHLVYYAAKQTDARYVLWLDVDIIVRDLSQFIIDTYNGFAIYADDFAPNDVHNNINLYASTDIVQNRITLNTGVFGLNINRDANILDEWISNTDHLLNDAKRQYVVLFDQGVLLYTFHKLKINTVSSDVRNNKNGDRRFIDPVSTEKQIIEKVYSYNDGANIIHFAGLPKLSQLCSVDSPSLLKESKHRETEAVQIVAFGNSYALIDLLYKTNKHLIYASDKIDYIIRKDVYASYYLGLQPLECASKRFLLMPNYDDLIKYFLTMVQLQADESTAEMVIGFYRHQSIEMSRSVTAKQKANELALKHLSSLLSSPGPSYHIIWINGYHDKRSLNAFAVQLSNHQNHFEFKSGMNKLITDDKTIYDHQIIELINMHGHKSYVDFSTI